MEKPVIGITVSYRWEENTLYLRNYYVKALEKAGSVPILIPSTLSLDLVDEILKVIDGILISGGGDVFSRYYERTPYDIKRIEPYRDEFEIYLIKKALEFKIPLLAICRGIQIINVALGGTLYQSVEKITKLKHTWYKEGKFEVPWWYPVHKVKIKKNTILWKIFKKEEIWVNSFHHQAIEKVGDNLIVSGNSEDGLVEAVEHENHPFFLGVQWHPEGMFEKFENQLELFRWLVKMSEKNKRGVNTPHSGAGDGI